MTKKELKIPPEISLKNCRNNNGSIKILMLSPKNTIWNMIFTFFVEDAIHPGFGNFECHDKKVNTRTKKILP